MRRWSIAIFVAVFSLYLLSSSREIAWGDAKSMWVYARYPYSEILQLACFLGMFRATLRVCDDPSRREAIWLGVWAGCLLNSKYVFALAIVGAAGLIAWTHRKRSLRPLGWAAA